MRANTLKTRLLSGLFAFTLIFGLGFAMPTVENANAEETMTVYYDFKQLTPSTSRPSSVTVGTNLLFAPPAVSPVSNSEAFLGLPSGCGMMQVNSLTKLSSNKSPGGGTFIASVKHPNSAQQAINTSVGFDGCNGAFCYYSDATYWHYWCDGGGVKNRSFRVYTYKTATVPASNLTARTLVEHEITPTDIKIPKNELEVKLNVNGTIFTIDNSRWTFVDDTVNYVKNDRQVTIQFGNAQASCNVDFKGAAPDPHAYKSVARDAGASGNLKVGETLHYAVDVKNEAKTGSIWKDVKVTDTLPVGLKLVPGSVKLARTAPSDQVIASIPLSSGANNAGYRYDEAARTMTLTIPRPAR